MPILTRVGWVDGMIVLAEDMLALEDNVDTALMTHTHGDGDVVPIDPAYVPAPAQAVGGVATLRDHLMSSAIHQTPNQNLPIWYTGFVSVPALQGDAPEWSTDVTLDPGFATTDYRVFLSINYSNASVQTLPDSCFYAVEILSTTQFRVHVRFIFNPFESHKALNIVWNAVGRDGGAVGFV